MNNQKIAGKQQTDTHRHRQQCESVSIADIKHYIAYSAAQLVCSECVLSVQRGRFLTAVDPLAAHITRILQTFRRRALNCGAADCVEQKAPQCNLH